MSKKGLSSCCYCFTNFSSGGDLVSIPLIDELSLPCLFRWSLNEVCSCSSFPGEREGDQFWHSSGQPRFTSDGLERERERGVVAITPDPEKGPGSYLLLSGGGSLFSCNNSISFSERGDRGEGREGDLLHWQRHSDFLEIEQSRREDRKNKYGQTLGFLAYAIFRNCLPFVIEPI